jgi:putative toxin-antitoxin system antitoxin component (TIGR02293 family)
MALAEVAEVLGGEQVLRQPLQSRLDLIALSRKGVPKEAVVHLAHFLSCTLHDLVDLLPVTERTLQRYTLQQPLNRMLSEHILQLAEVAARGVDVFGEKAPFLAWLHHPNLALGNHTPLSLLSSRFGVEMVLDELGRLEHGVIA